MQAYKFVGTTGVLRASARHFLKSFYLRFASTTFQRYSLSARESSAHPTDLLPTDFASVPAISSSNTALSSSAVAAEPTCDVSSDADGGAGPGLGSLRDAAAVSAASAAEEGPLPPGLYVIPTPIGNLRDITLRASDTLRRVNLLLAEDTRHTRKLLNFLGIRHLEVLSCHEHNEKQRLARVMQRLQQGEPVGLVSDAGMPGISDPGHIVVAAAVAAGVRVVALPGPCAFVTALVGSGLHTGSFTFAGFLPPKSGARRQALERLAAQPGTLVLYAAPHGLAAVLRDCVEVLGGSRRCCVAREISKVHEEYFRSTLEGALREFGEVREARGEICLLIEGCGGPLGLRTTASSAEGGAGAGFGTGAAAAAAGVGSGAIERVLRELLEAEMPVSAAVKEVVANLGANKKAAYTTALRLKEQLARKTDTTPTDDTTPT
ncbi:hypothetical protein VOLCADRAFT_117121 [Volvox carteri f. nagariensis]|uniref:Uncharacterized protein n=1 Tax=Volvox carteri f. nagariensis TaxID=3068 RepID=D8TSD0_VOLCA|nr:uncharacterized protein VOLCADRAFT_117121 [Volvox carteri f. nagariensis]EFJ49802.1 hypothetical protein VOLCADRAFT_117121 [Volvox carteri f. nagariensis]|eukprot:XP_002949309.1 hypothetical protein VOLCADRAFT_117121 [Volvox carteri f. nagariensis]